MNETSRKGPGRQLNWGIAILVGLCVANTVLALQRPDLLQGAFLEPQGQLSQVDSAPDIEMPEAPKVRLVKSPWRATPILQMADESRRLAARP